MGNNTSSPPKRSSSGLKGSSKPHAVHKEYTGASNGLGPVKLKSRPVVDGDAATVYGDRHTATANTATTPSNSGSSTSGATSTFTDTKPKVSTPSIILDDLVEADTDYFSKHIEESTSHGYGDDDDGYGIDEDLVSPVEDENEMRKVKLKYRQEGLKVQDYVYVVGSFDHWTRKVMLEPDYDEAGQLFFKTVLSLPVGIYKVKFLVNGYVKHTNDLPTATDKSGNFVNWFEVGEQDTASEEVEAGELERHRITNTLRKSTPSFLHDPSQQSLKSPVYSRSSTPVIPEEIPLAAPLNYSQDIPDLFRTPSNPEEILPSMDEEFMHKHPIPELPVYLNNNYLNKHFTTHHNLSSDTANLAKTNLMQGLNSHIIPHVNLKHLLTSNIKNGVLGVACTTRYGGKFVTQIMYSPASDDE